MSSKRLSLNDYILRPEFNIDHAVVIEASAGTGKTYQIQTLYMRLVVEVGIPVRNLLVVTFTEAATKELRDRLRAILHDCQRHLDGTLPDDSSDSDRIREIMTLPLKNRHEPLETEVERLIRIRRALMDFDLAAIFTIHGFCHRILTRYAFECGNEFGLELTTDSRAILDEVCEDWWRRELYPARGTAMVLRVDPGFTLKSLAQRVKTRLEKPDARFEPAPMSAADAEAKLGNLSSTVDQHVSEILAQPIVSSTTSLPTSLGKTLLQSLRETASILAQQHVLDALIAIRPVITAMQTPTAGCFGWEPPDAVIAFADACSQYVAACPKGTRATALSWDQGDIRIKGAAHPEVDAAVADIRRTWAACEGSLVDILSAPDRYPLKSTKTAKSIVGTITSFSKLLADSVSGGAADFHAAVKVLTGTARQLPGTMTVNDLLPMVLQTALVEIDGVLPRVLSGVLVDIANAFHERRLERRVLTFGDLLLDLREALADPDGGPVLRSILRREFHAGLIDEFQDTDPVQYEIFRRLLVDAELPVFLVGDPKQAIYGFRSGDIHTYYDAVENINRLAGDRPSIYSLDTNYRAESALVGAVNAMFRDSEERRVFINTHIDYPGTLRAHGKSPDDALIVSGGVDHCPIKIWYYDDPDLGGKRAPGQDSPFARCVYGDVADEVVSLLNDADVQCAGKPLKASDIAILVLTHSEGDAIYAELASRGVPVVRQKTGNVFDTQEAADLALVMLAMATPTDATAVRSALASSLIDLTDDEILAMENGHMVSMDSGDYGDGRIHGFDDYMDLFQTAKDRWTRRSFIEALNVVSRRTNMRRHLVRQEEGERKLTNLLQLAELVHQAAVERQLGVEGCIHWLLRQCDDESREESDAYEMRLETDDAAVRIMTVFRSKGLQFPVVFVPTMWRRKPTVRSTAEYHVPNENPELPDTLIVDLAPDQNAIDVAMKESLEEDIRLFYVAMTRAVNRVYLIWGNVGEELGPLRSVLDEGPLAVARIAAGSDDERIQIGCPSVLAAREEPAVGGVEILTRTLDPRPSPERYRARDVSTDVARIVTAEQRDGRPVKVDKSFGHSSFTGLTARHGGSHGHADHYDFDAADEEEDAADEEPAVPVHPAFAFPAGARTGECWHRIFEKLDYPLMNPDASSENMAEARALVSEQLNVFGFGKRVSEHEAASRRAAVIDMVQTTVQIPLRTSDGKTLRLCEIAAADCIPEFAFDFPLSRCAGSDGPATLASLVSAIVAHWPADPAQPWRRVFVERLQNLGSGFADMRIPRGYITGSIDLFFRHESSYYIVDWKSNRRGGTPHDFDPAGIHEEMADHLYFLQYLIYTVAVHNYLVGVLGKDYDYSRHFGGAYYVFLRAVNQSDPNRGVFYDRPPLALIEAVGEVLGDFPEGDMS